MGVVANLELVLVVGHLLALGGDARADHLGADVGGDDVRLAHIADAEHEAQLAVALVDDGVAAEEQRLRPHLGPRQLREDHAHHVGLRAEPSDSFIIIIH